jgi:hypothetical protein
VEHAADSELEVGDSQETTESVYDAADHSLWSSREIQIEGSAEIGLEASRPSIWKRLAEDQRSFYSPDSILSLGVVIGAGAAVANTSADAQIQTHFESSVHGASSDEWFEYLHANKELGNGLYTLPIFGVAWLAGETFDDRPAIENLGLWGERSTRAVIVGAPPLILTQLITGGSRPYETVEGSEWNPLQDNNGVSGHAFMSSIPFITAAKMADKPWQKAMWYFGSLIGPLSRVNDNAHYPSQVGMGWAIAFLSATAVKQTDTGQRGWTILPASSSSGTGFLMQYRW